MTDRRLGGKRARRCQQPKLHRVGADQGLEAIEKYRATAQITLTKCFLRLKLCLFSNASTTKSSATNRGNLVCFAARAVV